MPMRARTLCSTLLLIVSFGCADRDRSEAGTPSTRARDDGGVVRDAATRDGQMPSPDASQVDPPDAGRAESTDASQVDRADAGRAEHTDASPVERADASSAHRDGAIGSAADSGSDATVEGDGAAPDSSSPDAMTQTTPDSGTVPPPPPACEEFVLPPDCAPNLGTSLPSELRCTGLYANFAERIVACGLVEYSPAFELWSDGAVKRRWVSLPAGSRVETSNPDAFVYPVGTQFWKEFQVEVDGELKRAETRLFRKLSAGWIFTTYVWSDDQREATQTNGGVANWAGTGHTVPTRDHCLECHAGRADRILGWDPVLLGDGARGIHVSDLVADDALDDAGVAPPPAATIPGDAAERDALGYLHVNCGVSCHNPTSEARARDTAVYLQLATGEGRSVLDAPAVASTLNRQPTGHAPIFELPEPAAGPFYDLLPGSPERSLLLARMKVRNHAAQMPPIASNRVDERGVAIISTWIEQMTPARGYPPPAE